LLIKSYTSEACYALLNRSIVSGVDENVQDYLSLLVEHLSATGDKYAYKDFQRPVFRGMPLNRIDIEKDY
jgi:hypothetical protein